MFESLLASLAGAFEAEGLRYIHKLVAGRPRDPDDVRSIRLKMPVLDLAYIDTWITRFERNVGLRLRRSMAQHGR